MCTVLVHEAFFSGQDSQLAGQILFCPEVSVGHFQKLFRALYMYILFKCFPNVTCCTCTFVIL